MIEKVLIPLLDDDVAPRFDLATDVMVITHGPDREPLEERTVVLPQASAEKLCELAQTENASAVICGGIEDEYFQYLAWKKVRVVDSVIGPARLALERFRNDDLNPGQILFAPS